MNQCVAVNTQLVGARWKSEMSDVNTPEMSICSILSSMTLVS